MENLVFSTNATVPVFFMIFLGWLLHKVNILDSDAPRKMNKLIFNVLIPVLLVRDISQTEISESFSLSFFLFCFIATVLMFAFVWVYAIFFVPRQSRGSFVVCSCRGSAAVLGIAFAENIYGSSGMVPVMIIASVPLYNIMTVVLYSVYGGTKIPPAKQIFFDVVKNPIIIGIAAGALISVLKVDLPYLADKCLNSAASLSTPLALLMVGAGFDAKMAKKKLGLIGVASVFKLVAFEIIFLPIAALLGFSGQEMIALVVMCGSPATVAAYIMAHAMGNDEDLASGVVVFTTVLSAITVTAAVSVLHAFSLV